MAGRGNIKYYSTPMGRICINNIEEKGILIEIQNPSDEGDEVQRLKKQGLQVANYYLLFQAIIFAGYYNVPSDLKCRYRWIPLLLSFLAGFLNLCALINIACLYQRQSQSQRQRERDETCGDDHQLTSSPQKVYNLPPPLEIRGMSLAEKCAIANRFFHLTLCIGIILAFFVVSLILCWTIPCSNPPPPPPPTPT